LRNTRVFQRSILTEPLIIGVSLYTGPTERGHQTPRAGRYAARIGAQLQCEPSHDFQIVSSLKIKVAGLPAKDLRYYMLEPTYPA